MIKNKITISHDDSPFSLSVGDLMSCLLMMFILLLISSLMEIQKKFQNEKEFFDKQKVLAEKVKSISVKYRDIKSELGNELLAEFKNDLLKWNATLSTEELLIRFREPEVLFDSGTVEIKEKFQMILNDFFPRYSKILSNTTFGPHIREVRIEGHTSSEYKLAADPDEAYILNMELSQGRTREVLKHVLQTVFSDTRLWVQSRLCAIGLSSSHLVFSEGIENKELSRRVEFRVVTDSEGQIGDIIREYENSGFSEK